MNSLKGKYGPGSVELSWGTYRKKNDIIENKYNYNYIIIYDR